MRMRSRSKEDAHPCATSHEKAILFINSFILFTLSPMQEYVLGKTRTSMNSNNRVRLQRSIYSDHTIINSFELQETLLNRSRQLRQKPSRYCLL